MLSKEEKKTLYYWAHEIVIGGITRQANGDVDGFVHVRAKWTPDPSKLDQYLKDENTVRNLNVFADKVGATLGVPGMYVIGAISNALSEFYLEDESAAAAAASAELPPPPVV